MELVGIVDTIGEDWTLALGGGVVGLIFGAFAQQSRFCLRSAVIEFAHGSIAGKTAVWLIVFCAAIVGTAALAFTGTINTLEARQIASPQSLAGAAVGGLMFGTGMILARGCASRLLVLAATGNLRALMSGLVFAVVAQASLHGFLSPAREAVAATLTTASTGGNNLLDFLRLDIATALALSALALVLSLGLSVWRGNGWWRTFAALAVGLTIPLAWWFTGAMSGIAFTPVEMEAVTMTGPSADTLMLFLSGPDAGIDYDVGLVPGVFAGAFLAALFTRELKLQGFESGMAMRRYLAGAALMGFGGMLAGGCAVGAGVTGASVFALTAWVTLFAIWLSAGITDWVVDRDRSSSTQSAPASAGTNAPAAN